MPERHDEPRIARERHERLGEEIDRLGAAPAGAGPMLVKTKTLSSYPTAAGKYFAVTTVDPGGSEGEGNSGTFTAGSDTFYALNAGSAVPATGTMVIAHPIGGRWVFLFNG